MSTDPRQTCLDEAAILVSSQPGAVDLLLRQHQAGGDGYCTGCGRQIRWPCVLVAIANRADLSGSAR